MGAKALGDYQAWSIQSAHTDRVISSITVPIGAAGAVGTIAHNPLGITVTNTGTGTFDITFPPCIDCQIRYGIQKSAAATVTEAIGTAIAPTSGTASLRTSKAGTAANPANGDQLTIEIMAKVRGS